MLLLCFRLETGSAGWAWWHPPTTSAVGEAGEKGKGRGWVTGEGKREEGGERRQEGEEGESCILSGCACSNPKNCNIVRTMI